MLPMVMLTAAPMALTRMLHLARRLLALLTLRMLTHLEELQDHYSSLPCLMLSSEVALQRGPETLPLSLRPGHWPG